MNHQTVNGWVLLSLLMSTLVYAYPQQPQSVPSQTATQYIPRSVQHQAEYQHQQYLRQQQIQPRVQHYQAPAQWQQPQQQQQLQPQQQYQIRKFAEKPNNLKKVSLDDIDDDNQLNQIDSNAFSWTNMLGQVMQMMFTNANTAYAPPTKSDDTDGSGNSVAPSWTNVLAAGLKILSAFLGGGGNASDGIDKVDNGNVSPVQSILTVVLSGLLGNKDPDQVNIMAKQAGEFISIVVNLLDALKTSFSHRAFQARQIQKKDSVSELGIATIDMLKGYVKISGTTTEKCMQKYICEANEECNRDIAANSIFCQMGSYATSFILERQTGTPFEKFYEAGRQGRQLGKCHETFVCDK